MLRRSVVPVLAAIAAMAMSTGCATPPPSPVTAEQVSVHESVASAPVNFRIIKRLWIESWVSAFGTPSYDAQSDAMAAMRQQAASLGGNGIINFGCYRKSDGETPLGCNGTIVRFNP